MEFRRVLFRSEDFAVAVGLLLREVLTAAPAKGHEAVVFPSFLCGLYGLKALEAAMGLVVLAADKAFDLCRFAALPVVVVVAVSLIHATSAAEGVQIGPLADHEELIGPGGAGALEGLTPVGARVDILLPGHAESGRARGRENVVPDG